MLYKYYRYVIIAKILFLVIGGYLLVKQRYAPTIALWTSIIIQTKDSYDATSVMNIVQGTPWPWSLLTMSGAKTYMLHVPQTFDTWYIATYLKNPIPDAIPLNDTMVYTKQCAYSIIVDGSHIAANPCHVYGVDNRIWAIILILLWVLL